MSKDINPLLQDLVVSADAWSKFDLDSRRPLLDRTSAQCQTAKDQSLAARKSLSEVTKKFKKSVKACENSVAANAALSGSGGKEVKDSVDSLAVQCRTIVKAYQEEIDKLTRRCKASDSGFLNLYQSMYELPDPAVILRPVLEHVNDGEADMKRMKNQMDSMRKELENAKKSNNDLKKVKDALELKLKAEKTKSSSKANSNNEELLALRKEVAEYELEFRGLKNQDITIRKLESKIAQLQRESEQELSESIKKAQEQLAVTEGRRASEALEREAKMERKVQSLELELRAERAGRRAQEVRDLDASEGEGEREAAWEAQRQILMDDSERLRVLLYSVQKERDDLRLKFDVGVGTDAMRKDDLDGKAGSSREQMAERKAYEAEISELSLTAQSLRDELKLNEQNMKDLQTSMQTTISDLENKCSNLSQTVDSLNMELSNAPSQTTVDKMKRELRILKRLEYNAEDQEDMEMDSNTDNGENPEMTTDNSKSISEDLESVLVARLRKMEANLLKEKREKTESEEKCHGLEKQLESLQQMKESSDKLIASLESDLSKAISVPLSSSTPSNVGLDNGTSPLASIIDPNDTTTRDSFTNTISSNTSKTALEKSHDDHSVATIVMAQRDRLRVRCDALEAERDSFKKELQIQVQSAECLKTDNTKLYEKLRYLQSFQSSKLLNENKTKSNNSTGIVYRTSDLDLEALEERYEASVDPFRQFGRAERARKLKEMDHMERFVFITAKIVLGSKQMRTALVIYVMSLHFLVFITTYHWAHEGKCGNMELHPMLEHMHGGPPIDESALNDITP